MNPLASAAPTPATAAWFSRRRFGLFLHYGLYAIEGWHEQDQMRRRIDPTTYARLAERFDPSHFDPDAIIDLAVACGMEYLCLTAKHHDGFCLWDTAETNFNSAKACGRDLVAEFLSACQRRGIAAGIYYSVVDWRHPNYPNQGRHHELPSPKPGDRPDWSAYQDYLVRQVRELCSRYGKVSHFFWDMNVPEIRDPSINAMIRQLQPGIVINDRGMDEGDFGTPERDYQAGENADLRAFSRPTEACDSVGAQSWGYRKNEHYRTPDYLIRRLAATLARGGHFLLNVGPDGSGLIPPPAQRITRAVGDWYLRHRDAFGEAAPLGLETGSRDILLTHRGDTVFVQIPQPLDCEGLVVLPCFSIQPESLGMVGDEHPLQCRLESLPVHWQSGKKVLCLYNLPAPRIGAPLVVVWLKFPAGSPFAQPTHPDTFQG